MAAGGSRELRRSPRLIRMKELSACASEQDLILKLKREAKALIALKKQRLAREGLLDAYMSGQQKALRQAGAGKDRTAAEVPPPAGAGKDSTPAAAGSGKKVVKITKVPQGRIDRLILNHYTPFQGICDEHTVGKRSKRFREIYAEGVAISNKFREYEQAIIRQFRTKGYALDYTEVTGSDSDDDEIQLGQEEAN